MATSLGKGIASTASSAWTRQLSALVLYVIAARTLEPAEIGVFALATALVLLFEYAAFEPISEAVVQRAGLTPRHLGAALALGAILAAAILALGLGLAGPLERALAMPGLAPLVQAMAAAVALLCLSSAHAGVLRREARFHTIALLAAGAGVSAAALGAGLLLAGAGLGAMLAYFVAEKAILCLGTIWCARGRPMGRFGVADALDLVPYAAAIGAQRMVYYARSQADRLVIGALWGAGVLGVYQIAARIFDSLQAILLTPASKLFFVSYTRAQRRPEELRAIFLQSLQAVSLIAFPSFLGLSAVAPEAVALLFGARWEASAALLEVLAFGGVALVLSVMSGAVLSAAGHARAFLLVEVISSAAGLLLLAALSRFGVVWIAAAFVLREALAVALYVRLLGPSLGVAARGFLAAAAPCLAAAGAMWLVLASMEAWAPVALSAAAALGIKVGVGAACYGLVMLAFGRALVGRTLGLLAAAGPQP